MNNMFSEKDIERFWSHVDKNGPVPKHVPHLENCWLWTKWKDTDGYGDFFHKKFGSRAHRVSYMIHHNTIIPKNKFVLHHCDNPSCVRPSHLFLGTQKDNMQDKTKKGRGTKGIPRTKETKLRISRKRRYKQIPKESSQDFFERTRNSLTPEIIKKRNESIKRTKNLKVSDNTKREIYIKYLTGNYTQLDLSSEYNLTKGYIKNIVKDHDKWSN